MERETLCSTSVGNGIALPHPRAFKRFNSYSYIALCYLEKPVAFNAPDNEKVDILFFIFPKSERRFLRIQSKLFRLLRDEEVLEVIRKAPHADNICEIFARKEYEIFRDAS
jgi:mannitol/fructose-specific phosphotransferase system IIA component (Ntr-type)